jgi:hypothetical protein
VYARVELIYTTDGMKHAEYFNAFVLHESENSKEVLPGIVD